MKATVRAALPDQHEHHLRRRPDPAVPGLDAILCTDPACTLHVRPQPGYLTVGPAGMHSWS